MIFINDNKVSQVVCLNCYRRWMAVRPVGTWLDQLECPTCNQQGYAIETGEVLDGTALLERAMHEVEESNGKK